MLLGGIRYLLPVIEVAHKMGCYVITADYLPDNIAHKYSDEYVNVSIIDKEAVLCVAQDKKIDGIMSFGVDPGVVTAAYVAEEMGLPFQCSYESACILQDKSRFRRFLMENGFNCPKTRSFNSEQEVFQELDTFSWPVIVKPVDSAGSKGVTKVDHVDELRLAVETAFSCSFAKRVVIEDYLDVVGFQSSSDIFTVDGGVVYPVFSDQVFDITANNPFVPIAEIWPTTMPLSYQQDLTTQLNRLFELLQCRNGLYNVECRTCSNGKSYLMEVSPRGAGDHIAHLQDMALGTNIIENEIRAALNMPLNIRMPQETVGTWCTYTIHPAKDQNGTLETIIFDKDVEQDNIKFIDLALTPAMKIQSFTGANKSLGNVFLHFGTREEMNDFVTHPSQWMRIKTKN